MLGDNIDRALEKRAHLVGERDQAPEAQLDLPLSLRLRREQIAITAHYPN
jgi:hypothetical protein